MALSGQELRGAKRW
ncbi:hypothetical protein D049_1169A, partial [Vibrio parahaemolyticus VPTS-2010]